MSTASCTVAQTVVPAALLLALAGADVERSTSYGGEVSGARVPALISPVLERSFQGLPAALRLHFPETVASPEVPLFIGQPRPEDVLVGEVLAFRRLPHGWDGEDAAPPRREALKDAIRFLYSAGSSSLVLEPTLHVDGSVILEVGDGSQGSFRFKGDGQVICSANGMPPSILPFEGRTLPSQVRAVLG